MGIDWSSACARQFERDNAATQRILLGVGTFTVVLYASTFILSSLLWYRWWLKRKRGATGQSQRFYGIFISLICIGSVSGGVGWSARIKQRYLQYNVKNDAEISHAYVYAVSNQWAAVFCIFYAVSFLCASVSKLMNFVARSFSDVGKVYLTRAAYMVVGSVLTIDFAGIFANFASAFYWSQAARRQKTAAVYLEQANPLNATAFVQAQASYETALLAESVQRACEVVVLAIIVCAFTTAFLLMARIFNVVEAETDRLMISMHALGMTALQKSLVDDAIQSVKKSKRRIYSIGFIFVTFCLRAVWSGVVIRGDLGRYNFSCDPCGSCQDVGTLMDQFLFFCPEFSFSVIFVGEPLSYLVAICDCPPTLPTLLLLLSPIHAAAADTMNDYDAAVEDGGPVRRTAAFM